MSGSRALCLAATPEPRVLNVSLAATPEPRVLNVSL